MIVVYLFEVTITEEYGSTNIGRSLVIAYSSTVIRLKKEAALAS